MSEVYHSRPDCSFIENSELIMGMIMKILS
jgi:hypothetical protein